MNLFPGMGLGFTASKEIAFGLGAMEAREFVPTGGGGYSLGSRRKSKKQEQNESVLVYDNLYSRPDDDEIVEILSILFQVIA